METHGRQRSQSPAHSDGDNINGHSHDVSKKRKLSPAPSEQGRSSRSPKESRADGSVTQHDGLVPANGRRPLSPPISTKSPTADRRATGHVESLQEEKKRGRRLFGGLLSTLSQTTSSVQQKRRQDIERRQQERAHQRQADDDKLRDQKLSRLARLRKIEQIKFDEQVMKTRHSDILSKAHFLRTSSKPTIYYLPWKSNEAQQNLIHKQIGDAKELIRREKDGFERRKEQRMSELGTPRKPSLPRADTRSDGTDKGESNMTRKESSSGQATLPPPEPQTEPQNQEISVKASIPVDATERQSEEAEIETGDVMVEEDEDTVIY